MTDSEFRSLCLVAHRRAFPVAFAVIRDHARRGGVRVAKVAVISRWDGIRSAAVEETRGGLPHVLPFSRLSSRGGAVLGAKVRAQISHATDEKSAVSQDTKMAGAVAL